MSRRLFLPLFLIALGAWLAASYGVRYGLMENTQWVGLCVGEASRWECQARAGLGLLIHFRVIAWAALVLAVLGFAWRRPAGRIIAVLALLLGLPALVLYSASLAVFAVLIAGLRLVRGDRATARAPSAH